MKIPEVPMVQEEKNSRMSKARRQGEMLGDETRQSCPPRMKLSPIPIEWLDPDCWRLPSGKALAEFALQAGFLAPLMLGLPKPRRVAEVQAEKDVAGSGAEVKPGAGASGGQKVVRHGTRPASGAGKRI